MNPCLTELVQKASAVSVSPVFFTACRIYERQVIMQNKSAFVSSVIQWRINKIMQNRYTFLKAPGVFKKENEEVPVIPMKLRQQTGFIRPEMGDFSFQLLFVAVTGDFFHYIHPGEPVCTESGKKTAWWEFSCVSVNT